MSRLSATYTPFGKTCAEIASLANTLGACQTDSRVLGTLKAQLDAQMARLEAHLAAHADAPGAVALA